MSSNVPNCPTSCDPCVCVLASGSKGNAVYISDGDTAVLVDAGLSGIEIQRRMKSRGLSPEGLAAIIVSHEHTDHIHGVGVLSRRYQLPVYINKKTRKASELKLGTVFEYRSFECGCTFSINQLTIHPFSISHDAADPAGFTFMQNGFKTAIATDLGIATAMVREHLKGCRLLVLEANHDSAMLLAGPYPWHLKQRIKGRTGHLSNSASRDLLAEIRHSGLQHVILAHLSDKNNTSTKAIDQVAPVLATCGAELVVATQETATPLFQLKTDTDPASGD
ncbi:MAG: MBL fold metallo-hydrolase [Deltaproteobacteria bacterium]|nr:MBL fold metallo-hydrolase [Deltaproteobacteria bacterium]